MILTDEELVSKIITDKDTELFEVLYEKFSKNIYNKCYSFVRNEEEAKDLTQDIFLKLYLKLPCFEGRSKFSTWVYSFTYNHCVNYVSRNRFKKYEKRLGDTYDIENYSEDKEEPNSLHESTRRRLSNALKEMSEDDRSILVLKYQKDLSIKNLENILGIGASAVKMRIKRARERLANSYSLSYQ